MFINKRSVSRGEKRGLDDAIGHDTLIYGQVLKQQSENGGSMPDKARNIVVSQSSGRISFA